MKRNIWILAGTLVCLLLVYIGYVSSKKGSRHQNVLTVYTWIDFIPADLQEKFEKQTGIKLHIDFIDSDEALEAKLLTGKSEYDLVYPSTPYVFRHMNLGLYKALDIQLIPNLKYIDAKFLSQFQSKEKLYYSIPYLWGSSGFAYDVDILAKAFPGEKIDSWEYVFSPKKLASIAKQGVAVTSSANEFFVAGAQWQGVRLSEVAIGDIKKITEFVRKSRPHWTAFLSSDAAGQALLSGEVVLAGIWNGDAAKAKKLAYPQGKNLKYVIPKEGALQWVDSLAIPHNAPNAKDAHALINFLLEPKHMARVTNVVHFANTNPSSTQYVNSEIRSNNVLYPTPDVQARLVLDRRVNPKIERTINRYFFKILVGY